ncbi:MAG: fibronectin type III domain-containing protein [Bacteroidales bacterium]|nr:fibronectin type III domain-containing protein [Bacteroidales bacterium]
MKRFVQSLMFVAALLVAMGMNAQSLGDYTFTTGTDASKWITLTSYTDVSNTADADSYASPLQSIGFSFPFGEDVFTQFSVNSDGNLRLGPTVTGTGSYTTPFSSSNSNTNSPKINFLGCDGYFLVAAHHLRYQNFGDSLLVVEFCLGTYNSTTRNQFYSYQVHLYSNGNIDVVFGDYPAVAPNTTHQKGLCVNSSDGWIIDQSGNGTHFTSGSSTTWASGTWPAAYTYYTFTRPIISCPKPQSLNIVSMSSNSASFQIVPGGTETQWHATISPAVMGISEMAFPIATGVLPMLSPNTTYTVSVRSICGEGDTSDARVITFTTPCDNVVLPYTNNFDDATTATTAATGVMPDCWTLAHEDVVMTASTRPQIYYGASNAHSGSYSLRMYYRGILAMPGVDNVNNTVLSFWLKQTSATYPLIVGVMSNLLDESTFTPIDTIINTSTTAFQYHEIYFNNYTGAGQYIAFRNISTANYSYSYNYIDDIELTQVPTCVKTEAPTTAAVATTSATLTWALRDSTQNQFQVAYGTVNDLDSMSIVSATSNTKSIYGLTSNTNYFAYVRAICGEGDTSAWSFAGTFKTPCETAATPIFVEDFEALSGDEIPDCWTMGWFYQATGSGVKTQPYKTSTTFKHSGARAMTLQDQANGTSSWMSTQRLPIDRTGKYAVSVWVYRQIAATYPLEGIKLWLSPNADDTTGATFLGEVHRHYGAAPAEAASGWYNYQFPIEANGNKYILIQGTSSYGNATYFDDLEVYELPCEKATDYAENFESQDNNMVPLCWDNSASTSTTMNSNPHYIWGTYTYNGNKMMRMYNYFVQSGVATTNSPAIVLDSLNRELVFDYSHHASSGAVYVRISNDHGDTFTDVDTLYHDGNGNSYSDPGNWSSRSIDLSSYAGDTIMIQFYTVANYGNGSVFIDNIMIREINNCPIPTDLAAQTESANSASLSWNGTAAEYVVAYGIGTNPELMDTIHVFDTTALISGLNAETTYNFFVRSVCGENMSYWSLPAQAFTGYCQPAPTSVDGQGITRLQFGMGSEVVDNTTRPTAAPYYGNYYNMVGAVAAGTIADVNITYQTGYTYGTIIWVDWNNNLTFDSNEVVYVGESSATNPTTLNATFSIPSTADTGYYRMRIAGSDSYYDSYFESFASAANANPCPASSYTIVHDYTLHVTAAPACSPVTGVIASNISNTSADITWSLLDNTQNSFVVAYAEVGDTNMTLVNASTNSITLNGLNAATTYQVMVKAVCGADDESIWSAATTFTTANCALEDMCYIKIEMIDSYGDGWNGGSLDVVDSALNTVVGTAQLSYGLADSIFVSVCPDRTYNLVWNTGSYDDEVSFNVYNSFNGLIASEVEPDGGLVASFVASCSEPEPIITYTVTTNTNDILMGTVLGGGIYNAGDTVTLTAMPSSNSHFVEWTDGDTNMTRTFVVTSDTTFTATFAFNPVTVTLSYNDTVMGYTVPAAGIYTFQVGDVMNAMAYANTGYHFVNYTVSAMGMTDTSSFNPIAQMVPAMLAGQHIYVVANFEANNYTLTVNSNNDDMGTVTGAGVYAYNTTATLTATPAFNHRFVQWNDGDTNAVRNVVVTGDATYTAYFALNPVTVNLTVNDFTMGTTNPAAGTYTYDVNTTVNAEAIANEGFRFIGWNVNVMGQTFTYTENPVSVTIPEMAAGLTIDITANFEAIPTYEVSFTNEASEYYTLEGAGFYQEGDDVTVTFTAIDVDFDAMAITFNGWYVNGELVSTDAVYTFVMGTENVSLTADVTVEPIIIGIDDVNADNITIFSRSNQIVVRGAESQNVRIFDAVGRLVAQRQANGEEVTFAVQHTGVYLVQVGRQAARRVVVR